MVAYVEACGHRDQLELEVRVDHGRCSKTDGFQEGWIMGE